MVKLTAVGLRNYIDKTRARKMLENKRLWIFMLKHGGAGLSKIFPMGGDLLVIDNLHHQNLKQMT